MTAKATKQELSFFEKISYVQSSLKAPKNQKNKFGNYNYRSCEDILESLKPLLQTYKLVLSLDDKVVQIGERYYLEATATVTDGQASIAAKSLAREAGAKKGMDDAQITGSASSYARKYALNGLFCIDDTKDADFNNNHNDNGNAEVLYNELFDKLINCKTLQELSDFGHDNKDKLLSLKKLDKPESEKLRSIWEATRKNLRGENG